MSFQKVEGFDRFSEEERTNSLTSQSLTAINPRNQYTDLSLTTVDVESGLVIARHQKDDLKLPATNSAEERLLEALTTSPYPSVRRLYYYPKVTERGLVWDRISELRLTNHGEGFLPVQMEKIALDRDEETRVDLFRDKPRLGWVNQSLYPWVQQFHYTSGALHRALTLTYNGKGEMNYLFVNPISAESEESEHGYVIGDPESDGVRDTRYFARLRDLEDDGQDGALYHFWKPRAAQLMTIDVLTDEEIHRITLPVVANPGRILVDACHPLLLIRPADPSPQLDEGWRGTDFLMAANISWVSSPR